MKITITGKPKEIAALAAETQRRQDQRLREAENIRFNAEPRTTKIIYSLLKNGLGKSEEKDDEIPAFEE